MRNFASAADSRAGRLPLLHVHAARWPGSGLLAQGARRHSHVVLQRRLRLSRVSRHASASFRGINPVPVWRHAIGCDDMPPTQAMVDEAMSGDPNKRVLTTMLRFFQECEKYSGQITELSGSLDSCNDYTQAGLARPKTCTRCTTRTRICCSRSKRPRRWPRCWIDRSTASRSTRSGKRPFPRVATPLNGAGKKITPNAWPWVATLAKSAAISRRRPVRDRRQHSVRARSRHAAGGVQSAKLAGQRARRIRCRRRHRPHRAYRQRWQADTASGHVGRRRERPASGVQRRSGARLRNENVLPSPVEGQSANHRRPSDARRRPRDRE